MSVAQLNAKRARAVGFSRARIQAVLHRQITVGRRVSIGRRCRFFVDHDATLILQDGCEIDDGSTVAVYGSGTLEIGSAVFIGHHCTIAARSCITLGPGTFVAELVSIRDHDHAVGAPPSSGEVTVAPVSIGANVWIGAKATVLRGVEIGEGSVIGANAVVRGVVESRMVYAGVPARPIRPVDGHES